MLQVFAVRRSKGLPLVLLPLSLTMQQADRMRVNAFLLHLCERFKQADYMTRLPYSSLALQDAYRAEVVLATQG